MAARPTPPARPPLLVLIQGGIASGKSTVSKLLAARGAEFVDCDGIAHEALREPEVERAVRQRFGAGVFDQDGRVDRKRLGAIVFDDPAALRDLEALLHPRVGARVAELVADHHRPAAEPRAVLVIDAAVASKMRLVERWDLTIFVAASDEARRRRAATRGWPPGELERREARQDPLAAAQGRADVVVPNDGDVQETERHVDRVWAELIGPRR